MEVSTTQWVNTQGSLIPDPNEAAQSRSDNKKNIGLGVGLGVGLAVVFAIVGIIAWVCWRKRRRNQSQVQAQAQAPIDYNNGNMSEYVQPELPSQSVSPLSRIGRKPVGSTPSPLHSEKTELSGQHVTREISGRQIQPVPDISPSPVTPPPAQYEMWADPRPYGIPEQTQPVPEQTAVELGRSDPRYELVGR